MKRRDTTNEFRLAFFCGYEDYTRDIYHNLWADGQTPLADKAYRGGWNQAKSEKRKQTPEQET